MRTALVLCLALAASSVAAPAGKTAARAAACVATFTRAAGLTRLYDACSPGSPARAACAAELDRLRMRFDADVDAAADEAAGDASAVEEVLAVEAAHHDTDPAAALGLERLAERMLSAHADPRLGELLGRLRAIPADAFDRWARAEGARTAVPAATAAARVPATSINGSHLPKGIVCLTFDDGPHRQYTPKVLELLAKHKVRASFFELGQQAQLLPGDSQAEHAAGHDIGAHSISHPQLTTLSHEEVVHQVAGSRAMIKAACGVETDLFRCPYGAVNASILQVITDNGMKHILWNVDSLDWSDHDPASIVKRALGELNAAGRGIILFHDIHPQSVTAADLLLDKLAPRIQSGEIKLVTVHEALALTR